VPLSSLIVTSSGKISRARARQKYVVGGFEDLSALAFAADGSKRTVSDVR